MTAPMRITILGLSITSSWGNGHATTFRHLVEALHKRGHEVLFLERDVPWYASNRDLPEPPFGTTRLYSSLDELYEQYAEPVQNSDLCIVGSYVPDGVQVGTWATRTAGGVTAFYDIDTPVTVAKLGRGDFEYLTPELIPQYDLYLSFTGGPVLQQLEGEFGSPCARPLYCSVDPQHYFPEPVEVRYDLAYMGTYSDDRQPPLERLLLEPARQWPQGRFAVAGPQYPADIQWPGNVQRYEHLPPASHRQFYNSQRFTLNITRADMVRAGYAPSIRLFEAAACGVPVISDYWPGLDAFFRIGQEILVASSADEMLQILRAMPDEQRQEIGEKARRRALKEHTGARRAEELERYVQEVTRMGTSA